MTASVLATPSWETYSQIAERSYPQVKLARGVTFDEIWTLFLESGFLYPEKIAKLQPVLPEIQRSVRALLAANGHLMATVAVRPEEKLEAQISLLRWPSRTWMVQHLAAMPMSSRALHASAQATLALVHYAQLRPDMQYAKMFFRPNNAWPSRVFGGYARRIQGDATSDLRVFHYLVAPVGVAPAPTLPVRAATTPADFAMVEHWFHSRGRYFEVEANELEAWRGGRVAITADYQAAGLQRRREVLVVERHGAPAGFALLEVASLGLNFSELTNAFTVHPLDDDDNETRTALAAAARARYRELGLPISIALEESDRLEPFAAAGFASVKDYACWTFHRRHFAGMEEYFVNLFSARRREER